MSSSAGSPSTSQMVGIYSRLFSLLAVITIGGIAAVYFFHIPMWLALLAGIALIAIKSSLVVDAFKQFMVGKNVILIIFGLTICFVIGLLFLPLANHASRIEGTQDISKQLQMEEKPEATHHAESAHHGD